jgi:predicted RNA polymerase sigma factor
MDRSSENGSIGIALSKEDANDPSRKLAEEVARRSYGKLVAFLAARTRDVAAAEDALSEAFASALIDWPKNGCPSNPEAWLMTAAKRKGIDATRRGRTAEYAAEEIRRVSEVLGKMSDDVEIPDRRLGLMFACAHPAIESGIRAALILQVVLGLNAARIASAFLMSPATMGQRLVRAKKKIGEAGVPLRIPEREELRERLDAVLDAIYGAFAEGWIDASGADPVRRELAEEAIFLGRLVVEMLPEEAEALGLLALMLHAEARRPARRNSQDEFVPFSEQDVALWNMQMIGEAEGLLRNASKMATMGRYQLEAALQSAHVFRKRTGEANWKDVVDLYDALFAITHSPVVIINRALAIAEIDGAKAGLESLVEIEGDARLAEYQPYWAARAELSALVGATREAYEMFERAIGLERDPAVRRFLQQRQALLPA